MKHKTILVVAILLGYLLYTYLKKKEQNRYAKEYKSKGAINTYGSVSISGPGSGSGSGSGLSSSSSPSSNSSSYTYRYIEEYPYVYLGKSQDKGNYIILRIGMDTSEPYSQAFGKFEEINSLNFTPYETQ